MKLFRWKQQREEELKAEIQSHLDEAIRDRIARGETPDEARRVPGVAPAAQPPANRSHPSGMSD